MFRRQPARERAPELRSPRIDWALLVVAGGYALLPFGRLLITGAAEPVDMGAATIMLTLVLGTVFEWRRERGQAR